MKNNQNIHTVLVGTANLIVSCELKLTRKQNNPIPRYLSNWNQKSYSPPKKNHIPIKIWSKSRTTQAGRWKYKLWCIPKMDDSSPKSSAQHLKSRQAVSNPRSQSHCPSGASVLPAPASLPAHHAPDLLPLLPHCAIISSPLTFQDPNPHCQAPLKCFLFY